MKALALLLVLSIGACSSHEHDGPNADEYFYDCENPARPAGLMTYATDEAYREFSDKVLASGVKKDDTQSAQLTAPAADGTLSIAAPPSFTFTSGMTFRTTPRNPPSLPRSPSRWQRLRKALSFEGTAWAHCPTVSGTLYLLEITPAGAQTPVYTALSSVLSFTPGKDAWKAKLEPQMGKKVTVSLARGVFSMGHLELGPFAATKDVSFTVGP